jgi:hypothetical protein
VEEENMTASYPVFKPVTSPDFQNGNEIAMAGATCALLWAAVLFLLSLLLAGPLSINLTANLGASPQKPSASAGENGLDRLSMSKSCARR